MTPEKITEIADYLDSCKSDNPYSANTSQYFDWIVYKIWKKFAQENTELESKIKELEEEMVEAGEYLTSIKDSHWNTSANISLLCEKALAIPHMKRLMERKEKFCTICGFGFPEAHGHPEGKP